MMGQDIEPATYHHYAKVDDQQLKGFLRDYRAKVADVVNELPSHADFIRQYAPANPRAWDSGKR
jgi:hypothetical protein